MIILLICRKYEWFIRFDCYPDSWKLMPNYVHNIFGINQNKLIIIIITIIIQIIVFIRLKQIGYQML